MDTTSCDVEAGLGQSSWSLSTPGAGRVAGSGGGHGVHDDVEWSRGFWRSSVVSSRWLEVISVHRQRGSRSVFLGAPRRWRRADPISGGGVAGLGGIRLEAALAEMRSPCPTH